MMLKMVALSLAAMLLLETGITTKQQFTKYRKVDAYEVRPGILMMPRFTADDQVCEIGLQRLLYSPELIRVDSDLSRKDLDLILADLVPADERGKPVKSPLDGLVTEGGHSTVTSMDFENVVIDIYGGTGPQGRKGEIAESEVVVTVKWKKRTCR
ncbi:MAG: hypothetical protein KGK08_06335 [Acidobacteriota bacterium]|nr:hypothetical protein [Acidobacteriota bacterium]